MNWPKTELSYAEMLLFLMGYGIDRPEKPNNAKDLVGQTWRLNPEREVYELVEEPESKEGLLHNENMASA